MKVNAVEVEKEAVHEEQGVQVDGVDYGDYLNNHQFIKYVPECIMKPYEVLG